MSGFNNNGKAVVIKPMDKIFDFIRFLDTGTRGNGLMNYNVRGDTVTIYMPVDMMLQYVGIFLNEGYDNKNDPYWEYHGYAKNGHYFRIGPYRIRLAQYREKLQHTNDLKWLQEKHADEISILKKQLSEANNTINEIKNTINATTR